MPIPIFIITRDRVTPLKKSIASYIPLGDIEIVIHDNNSTYPPMIEYLKELESQGIKVYRNPDASNTYAAIGEEVDNTIRYWYMINDSDYYIVTDPDIELESADPNMLKLYAKALKQFPQATVIGTMLRIDDIPDCFKFKETMIYSHKIQFWNHTPKTTVLGHDLLWCAIDTTFGMYRKGFRFRRLNLGFRSYAPYMARHLDWYQDSDNLTEEEQYYRDHASSVSTLSNYNKQGYMG